ncbi:MAG: hypothetical protein LRY27_02020 [Chitinophagales bacterium]|nr:hypothetical protein [Chitinophagales bacterium]
MYCLFMSDSVWSSWKNNKETSFDKMQISNESEISASFMEGMLMALEEMKFNAKFDIQLFDNKNNATKNEEILETIKNDSFDVIIGPMKKSQLLPFTEYTAANKIIHISPFSPSKSASAGNEKYYQIEPSLEQHILNMVNFGIDSFKTPHIIFMYSDKGNGGAYATLIENYLNVYNKDKSPAEQVTSSIVAYNIEGRSLDKYMQSGKKT